MRTSRLYRLVTAVALIGCTVAPRPALAQAALSMLGFGYPLGGQSARSLSSGASLSDVDPQTPLNPASIVLNSRAQAYGQYEPEFRTVSGGGRDTKTTTSRFPLFMVTGHQGKATFALSFSSFMDRSWTNTYADTQQVGSERLASTVVTQSIGGIAEARGAMAWSFSEKVHLGIAAHLYPGDNTVTVGRIFSDSSRAGSFSVTNRFAFSGTAVSLGAVVLPGAHFILAGDVRFGGELAMRIDSATKVGQGTVPFRYGLSASYDGVPGAVFSARFAADKWSDLHGLGSATLGLKDATDMSVGTEIAGPKIAGSAVLLRAGYRSRGLPFSYGTNPVNESSVSGGAGIPLIGGRANVDVGLTRATRTAGGISEKAWLVSIGVGIRP
jgi:hypothetical protein